MTSLTLTDHELLRARWRRSGESLGLTDPQAEGFGFGGGRHVESLSVRFLILPGDPQANVVSFDEDFWAWWLEDRPNPFGGRPADWGNNRHPTTDAAVRHDQPKDDAWLWDTYLAFHRSGALEFGLGTSGAGRHNDDRIFLLIAIIGHIWVALSQFTDSLKRFGIPGPWELSLALTGTRGARLGDFASGWMGPFDIRGGRLPRNPHLNLRHVREVFEWPPDADALRSLAFDFGDVVEDSWGRPERRYLSNAEPEAGQFDAMTF